MSDDARYQVQQVHTSRGDFTVAQWSSDSDPVPVLAIHGITANHLAWVYLARALPGRRVVAPDLRGRGGSPANHDITSGMAQHADDMAAILHALGVPQVDVVGSSMGGFVAAVMADRHPDLVRRLVFADGGLPLVDPDAEPDPNRPQPMPDQIEQAVLAPLQARLSVVFPDREANLAAWRAHPAFQRDWSDAVAEYVDYDLHTQQEVSTGAPLGSRVDLTTIEQDSLDLLRRSDLPRALANRTATVIWLTAPRGLQNEEPPLYPEPLAQHWLETFPWLERRHVPDVNHYTIIMSQRGARQIAAALNG